ncbi:MAG: hypothetical protein INR65_19605, partial [Gluconacetobacter diazotrophicus]|nr:hypothetical protein [Gluconacetobacter diazotrophicus]
MTSKTAYPQDVATVILDRWQRVHAGQEHGPNPWLDRAPSHEALARLVQVCYQASLLREELRPVTFRLILAEPGMFPCDQGPPEGLHCLRFSKTRPFNPLEARRLSPAANFNRSLVGVCLDDKHEAPRIWGILHSGLRWLQNIQGGRGRVQTLPPALVLSVTGPGQITVGFGSEVIARADAGRLLGASPDVFESKWIRQSFAPVREALFQLHDQARQKHGVNWAPLDPMLVRIVSQHAIKRLISALRSAHHGATILFLPDEFAAELGEANRYIDLKYRFSEGEPRNRFRSLVVNIMNRVAELYAGSKETVGWLEYALSNDENLAAF